MPCLAEGLALEGPRVTADGAQLPPGPRVPEADGAVRTRGGDDARVLGTEGHTVDLAVMAAQSKPILLRPVRQRGGVPNADPPVVTRRDEPLAVGPEHHAANVV